MNTSAACLVILISAGVCLGQSGQWDDQFAPPRIEGQAIVIDSEDQVYIAGNFAAAGIIPFNNVARWSAPEFELLGEGAPRSVRKMAFDSLLNLYVLGGNDEGLLRWNSSGWTTLVAMPGGRTLRQIAFTKDGDLIGAGGGVGRYGYSGPGLYELTETSRGYTWTLLNSSIDAAVNILSHPDGSC